MATHKLSRRVSLSFPNNNISCLRHTFLRTSERFKAAVQHVKCSPIRPQPCLETLSQQTVALPAMEDNDWADLNSSQPESLINNGAQETLRPLSGHPQHTLGLVFTDAESGESMFCCFWGNMKTECELNSCTAGHGVVERLIFNEYQQRTRAYRPQCTFTWRHLFAPETAKRLLPHLPSREA